MKTKIKRMFRKTDGKPVLVNIQPPRMHGDPRTTGRQETASQRRKRKRAESRGHVARRRTRGDVERWGVWTDPVQQGPEVVIDSLTDEQRRLMDEIVAAELQPDGRCHGLTKLKRRCKNKTDGIHCKTHAKEQA